MIEWGFIGNLLYWLLWENYIWVFEVGLGIGVNRKSGFLWRIRGRLGFSFSERFELLFLVEVVLW